MGSVGPQVPVRWREATMPGPSSHTAQARSPLPAARAGWREVAAVVVIVLALSQVSGAAAREALMVRPGMSPTKPAMAREARPGTARKRSPRRHPPCTGDDAGRPPGRNRGFWGRRPEDLGRPTNRWRVDVRG